MIKRYIILLFSALLIAGGFRACGKPKEEESPIVPSTPAVSAEAETKTKQQRDIVIIYTNDVHCGNHDASEYAQLAAYKKQLVDEGNDVLLVDAGDHIQGGPIGTVSKGAYIIDIMNKVGYDAAIPGNHEFDYGMDTFLDLTKQADFPYLSCNFMRTDSKQPVLECVSDIRVRRRQDRVCGDLHAKDHHLLHAEVFPK